MPYTVSIDKEKRFVRVVLVGAVDVAHVAPMAKESRAAAKESGFNILYDARESVAGDMKTADLFWFPRNIPQLTVPNAGRVRTALLHKGADRPMIQFWEDAFNNAGLQARAFEDEALAVAWLHERDQ